MRHARNLPRPRRRLGARAILGLGLAALVATVGTACSTHAGAAAQVGDATIETSTLRDMVDRGFDAFKTVPADQVERQLEWVQLQPAMLTILVEHELITQEAERLGVGVSGQEVDAYQQAYLTAEEVSIEEFNAALATQGLAAEDARLLIENMALTATVADELFPDLVNAARAGYDNYVILSAQRGERPLSLEGFIYQQQRLALEPVLIDVADQEGVSVNPRFGVWDSDELAVVFADGSIATTPLPEPSFDVTALS